MKAPSPLTPHGLPYSPDGVQKIPIGVTTTPNTLTFQSQMCGVAFGIETMSIAQALVSKFYMMSCHLMWSGLCNVSSAAGQQPFIVGVYTGTPVSLTPANTGFNLYYTQVGSV